MKALHALGPDYQATFLPSEFDAGLEQAPASHALLVEGRDGLAAKLAMSYNAQAKHCPPVMLCYTDTLNGYLGAGIGMNLRMKAGCSFGCCSCSKPIDKAIRNVG